MIQMYEQQLYAEEKSCADELRGQLQVRYTRESLQLRLRWHRGSREQ